MTGKNKTIKSCQPKLLSALSSVPLITISSPRSMTVSYSGIYLSAASTPEKILSSLAALST